MRSRRFPGIADGHGSIRRVQRCTACLGADAEERLPEDAVGPRAAIARLQRTHGNAYVARRVAALARASRDDELAKPPPNPDIPKGLRPPGYKPGGPVPALAAPNPCGTFEYHGENRQPDFYPNHIQTSAHYVAHEYKITGGETCQSGFSVRVQDVIAGKQRIPWGQAAFEDLWTDHGTQMGFVVALLKTPAGATEYEVVWFDPATCKEQTKRVTGGFLYR